MVPGFPLVTFYLNAKDLRAGLELDAVGTTLDNQYFLQVSGMKFTYDTTKPPFGRVTSISLVDDTGTATPLTDLNDTTTCYKVVATNYVAGLLGLVKTLTSGLLEVKAKAADCATPIDPTQPASYVNANPTGTARELKHWQALLQYVSGLPNNTVPAAYGAAQGRITKTP
jgi:5'-nucleotidase